MRILVLGGTRFVSYATAVAAVARGHDVTCAARGESGAVPDGARLVHLDRAAPDFAAVGGPYDAVVDTATRPSWARGAAEALGTDAGHWTYVSSASVYPDSDVVGQTAEAPTLPPAPADADETSMAIYGNLKVTAEDAVRDAVGNKAFVVRPGLIVGPGDRSGRFTYWIERFATALDGAPVLGPGSPGDPVQVIDVRDLADWIVRMAEQRYAGTLDAISPPLSMIELLADVAEGVDVPEALDQLVWLGHAELGDADVEPWMGPRSLPLWLPHPEYAAFMTRDVSASLGHGLRLRPFADTARDTLAWLLATPGATRTGITREEEAEILADVLAEQ